MCMSVRVWQALVEEAGLRQERTLEAHQADLQNVWKARDDDLKVNEKKTINVLCKASPRPRYPRTREGRDPSDPALPARDAATPP